MGKSRADIQRAYRERKKAQNGKSYLQKECNRVMKYYVPANQLPQRKLNQRNKKAAERNRKHRNKIKEMIRQNLALESLNASSSGYDTHDEGSRLIVKLPLPNSTKNLKAVRSKAVARAQRKLREANLKIEELSKRCKTKQKMIERLRAKRAAKHSPLKTTPRSKTNRLMKNLNLTPSRAKSVRRQLLLGNVIVDEISKTRKSCSRSKKQELFSMLAGKISKKYRCLSNISKVTGFSRKSLTRHSRVPKHDRRIRAVKHLQAEVEQFLGREDNCRIQPGKRDVKKCDDGSKKQTKVLTDYLSNLHRKFLAENPNYNISLASFCRLRPKNVLTARFISRQACLCIRHQNMALKMQALRNLGVSVNQNPEQFDADTMNGLVRDIPDTEQVKYRVWKRVVDEKNVKRMKIVETSISKNEFVSLLKSEAAEFQKHVERLKEQYKQIRVLKENLQNHHMIVQMDFAENFICKSVDEVQSAYWHQVRVTLHPAVVYFKGENDELCHQSFVVVSDELGHNTTTVWAILDLLIPELKKIDPEVACVHYWTDSPSSQYRNKHMFYVVVNHSDLYGFPAKWNYFEAGHGKGPCDGLGGTTKRMADDAIKTGSFVIQDAKEFFTWANQSSMREVRFLWLSKETVQRKQHITASLSIRPVKGTMKFHAICAHSNGMIGARETSCYCDSCINIGHCDSWQLQGIVVQDQNTQNSSTEGAIQEPQQPSEASHESVADNECSETSITYEIDEFVACMYERKWYIGRVLDADDEDVQVSFMKMAKALFQWPNVPDIIWVSREEVLCKIQSPTPSGKSSRFFKLLSEDYSQIEVAYKVFLAK